jgi:AbrB family looped-hinge helix DNA binding protein
MHTAKVTSKGQITIPVEVRKALGLETGTKVRFFEQEDGSFVLKRMRSLMELAGCLKGLVPPMTVEQMDEAIGDYVVELDEATKSGAQQVSNSEAA